MGCHTDPVAEVIRSLSKVAWSKCNSLYVVELEIASTSVQSPGETSNWLEVALRSQILVARKKKRVTEETRKREAQLAVTAAAFVFFEMQSDQKSGH